MLIKGATIISVDPERGTDPFTGDILIEDDRIKEIGPGLEAPGAEVIDGRDRLVMPGLVNAHLHSWEAFFKGRYENLPLELWMLYSYPIRGLEPLSDRLIYLRTMLVGDGVAEGRRDLRPRRRPRDAGSEPRPARHRVPGLRGSGHPGELLGPHHQQGLHRHDPVCQRGASAGAAGRGAEDPGSTTKDFLDFARDAIARFHGRAGRLRYVIAPSGPQRCTEDLLVGAEELSREHGLTYHIHILETKVQAVTGREFYGKTLIRYMHDLGALSERTTIAHSVWVTDEDIELMADAGVPSPITRSRIGSSSPASRRFASSGTPASRSRSAPTASGRTTRRASSTSCGSRPCSTR